MSKEKYYSLSYGGGVNSSALYFYIVHIKKLPLDLVIFSDTGEESEETYNAVKRLKEQCKKDNIKFVIVKSKYGRLVDYYTEKKAVPSIMKRDCTSKFKISPIRQYYKEIKKKYHIIQYIGIAFDELTRIATSDVEYITYSYPFCEDKITRKGNIDILKQFNFKAVKSGCLGCPYQSKDSWINLYREKLEQFKRWQYMEENSSRYKKTYEKVPIMEETGNWIDDEDDDGEPIKRREKVFTGKYRLVPKKPIYLNGNYSLKQIENFIKSQKSLEQWINKNDGDLVCKNTAGGCFL